MKKTFSLTSEKLKTARLVDAIKHEVKKYIKRERNKTLPEDADFWDFDCKFGQTEESASKVHLSTLNKHIDKAVTDNLTSFYLEIMAKAAHRNFTPRDLEDFSDEELED